MRRFCAEEAVFRGRQNKMRRFCAEEISQRRVRGRNFVEREIFLILQTERTAVRGNKVENMKKTYMILTALLMVVACGGPEQENIEETTETQEQSNPLGFDPDPLRCDEGKVKNGQFFSTLLGSLGMSAQEAYNLTQACADVFDVKTLRVGNAYKAYYGADSHIADAPQSDNANATTQNEEENATAQHDSKNVTTQPDRDKLQYLVYDRDRTSCIVFRCQEPYESWVYEKPVTVEPKYADVTINTSLWVDMRNAGVSPELIISLSDIYAWTVDFFGLQKGDRFRVLYDEKSCDGEVVAVDTVRYAIFSHDSQEFPCIMFDQKDGGNIYWNEKGESMRKAFLKAPLKFSRISSGFSYARKHPVTRKVRPHTGVDYAAPKGTPVMTIGDGVITSMKYEGAGGNTIRIRHNSVYSTAYLHLSGYAKGLKTGQRVRQGQVIGYVGSTGRSTGPHLDFRVWKNGSPINPLKMQSPPAEPLKEANSSDFRQQYEKYRAQTAAVQARDIADKLFEIL